MRSVPNTSVSSLPQGNVSGPLQSEKGAGHPGRLPSFTQDLSAPPTDSAASAAATAAALDTTKLDLTDLTVLQAVMSNDEPLTAGKTAKVTGLDPDCASRALEILCAAGLVRRLNTVIISYSARTG
jgi:hypothetical protein